MKNHYFGDSRDIGKYELLLDLVECHGSGRLTYIPMLTRDDDPDEGKKTKKMSVELRAALHDFLREAVVSGRQDIMLLREILHRLGVRKFMPYRDY